MSSQWPLVMQRLYCNMQILPPHLRLWSHPSPPLHHHKHPHENIDIYKVSPDLFYNLWLSFISAHLQLLLNWTYLPQMRLPTSFTQLLGSVYFSRLDSTGTQYSWIFAAPCAAIKQLSYREPEWWARLRQARISPNPERHPTGCAKQSCQQEI